MNAGCVTLEPGPTALWPLSSWPQNRDGLEPRRLLLLVSWPEARSMGLSNACKVRVVMESQGHRRRYKDMLPMSPHTNLPMCHSTRYTDFRALSKDAGHRTQDRGTDLVCGLGGDAALKAANLARCETDSPHQASSSLSPKATLTCPEWPGMRTKCLLYLPPTTIPSS